MEINISRETRLLVLTLLFIAFMYYNFEIKKYELSCAWEPGMNSEICTTPEYKEVFYGIFLIVLYLIYLTTEALFYVLSMNFIITLSIGVKDKNIINEVKVDR